MNFKLTEFDSKDGQPMPFDVAQNVLELMVQLQILRDHFGVPIHINSGYRSPQHNRSVNGGIRSQHLLGNAADIVVEGVSPDEVADTIEMLIKDGKMRQGGLGRYKTFTHYDIRRKKARWDNR